MGGGDVKLLACLALWMNFTAAIWLVASTLIAGGILAIGFIATRPFRRAKDGRSGRTVSRNIPYGIAIAAGACLVFAGQLGLLQQKPAAQALQSVAKYKS
jgi:prepilin peptidase CpaA